ncbi:hypothetical protein HYV73_00110 [Candidatus Uhrbacteria bacterium]|nr:hypothetical protein [Candidatus Uhrbacteria bacterium]
MHSMKQLLDWIPDWYEPSESAVTHRQLLLEGLSDHDRERGNTAIHESRLARDHIIGRFASPYESIFDLEMSVSLAMTLERLLNRAKVYVANGSRTKRLIWSQAISLFDLAVGQMFLDRMESLQSASSDLEGLLAILEDGLFDGSFHDATVRGWYDPVDSYRAREAMIEDGPIPRGSFVMQEHSFLFRRLTTGEPVHLSHRVKLPFMTLLKIMRQLRRKKDDAYTVRDRRAVRLVVADETVARQVASRVQDLIHRAGGTCVLEGENLVGGVSVDQENANSHERFRAIKMLLHLHQKPFELQVLPMRDHLNCTYGGGDENHRLYRLRQMLREYFPRLLPWRFYRVPWRLPHVESRCRASLLSQLGWFYR